jgi:hypothetical protein
MSPYGSHNQHHNRYNTTQINTKTNIYDNAIKVQYHKSTPRHEEEEAKVVLSTPTKQEKDDAFYTCVD